MKSEFWKKWKNRISGKGRDRSRGKQILVDVTVVLISLLIFTVGGLAIWATTLDIPDFQNFDRTLLAESTKIYDRTGETLLYDVHGDVKRTTVSLEDISPHVKNATIALEDSRFYEHYGVRPDAVVRAALENITEGELREGGSTITQQVVKNTLLTNDKNFIRKAQEAVIAIKMDAVLSKKEILEAYLNVVPYGGSVYGVEEAAKRFFGKSAKDLNIAESAYLASLPKAPTYYSPYNNRQELNQRKNYTLQRMRDLGYISQSEYETARAREVTFADPEQENLKAPHFTLHVLEKLEKKYGRQRIEQAGLRVTTTLDYNLYQKAQKIIEKGAQRNARVNNANNMGAVGIDPKNGQILLMVGSRDYFSDEINGKFNVTTSHNRQPGSSFKPIVYSAAFEKGYTPQTILFDVPTQFSTACGAFQTSDCGYSPQNYDEKFRGPVTMREALAQSINIPAIKTLYLAGTENTLDNAQALGVSELKDESEYGLSLGLGAAQVSVLDMASAYSTLAAQGKYREPVAIRKVVDKQGNVLREFEENSDQVIDKQAALKISDILSDNVARTPLYGANSPLYFGGKDVAAKTGTTNNYRDAWTIGYTKNFSLAMWAGNNDNSPMAQKVSGLIITPSWRDVMDEVLKEYPAESFEEPESIPSDLKSSLRGTWNPDNTDKETESSQEENPDDLFSDFLDGIEPSINTTGDVHNILHWVEKDNPRGPAPQNPASDPQYSLWEPQVRAWVTNGQGIIPQDGLDSSSTPSDSEGFRVSIDEPDSGEEFERDQEIDIELEIDGGELAGFEVYINTTSIGTGDDEGSFSFTPESVTGTQNENTIRIIAESTEGNRAVSVTNFEIE